MGRWYGKPDYEFKKEYYNIGEESMFKGTIVGRMGRDPEQKQVGQYMVVSFSVPNTRKVKGNDVTDWVNVNVWGKSGKYVMDYGSKGRIVSVSGDVYQNSYTAKDGTIKSSLNMNADSVSLHGSNQNKDQTSMIDKSYEVESKSEFTSDDLPF